MVTLPGYTIQAEIHQGLRNLVYRGRRNEDRQPVVIKIHRVDHPLPQEVVRFRREYDIGRLFAAPGIIHYYGLEKYGHGLALITEDFGAVDLAQLIERGPLELLTFLEIAIQLAAALGEIHQKNIIHKDLKPLNIVVHPDRHIIKIIDFGLASRLPRENQQLSHPNMLEGTLAYISPEQTGRMNRVIDYRADFYSLGVTFYQLLIGRLPFQSADPLAWVHAHIAKRPTPPCELNPAIPPLISDIVMKLLAKAAEDRYKSAYGLQADLVACLEQLQGGGPLTGFSLGRHDVSARFQIPQKLYGREAEIDTLLAAFERASAPPLLPSRGGGELLLVSGYAGVGKSALIHEIHKPITQRRGYFISGKFDHLRQRNIPYSAVTQACQELIQQLLTESEADVAGWQAKLLAAVGPNGRVLTELIPQVELIIGPQPAVAELGPAEAQHRFNLVFQRFISLFAQPEHPLVIFLDDLQWADVASLKLIQAVMTQPDLHHLLFIGAYRDNEVGPAHPLQLTLAELRQSGLPVNLITLTPLTLAHITQLIADTLTCPEAQAQPLAELALEKTQGNPFFLNQFLTSLYEDRLLTFAYPADRPNGSGGWQWQLEQIRARGITANVVELMAGKLQKLLPPAQQVLKLAACMGNQFDLSTLALIAEETPVSVAHALQPALQEGLIILPVGRWGFELGELEIEAALAEAQLPSLTYKFLHDRVQQAAYSLIPAADKPALHLKIGRLMLERLSEAERDEKIFDIVNHLNAGAERMDQPAERLSLARFNLAAGRKAKASAAYEPARQYFSAGLSHLPAGEQAWQTDYELALALYTEAVEAAYLNTDFEQMDRWAEVVLQQTRTLLDKIKVYEVKIQAEMAQGHMLAAVETGRHVLQLLGISLPPKPGQLHVLLGLLSTKLTLGRKKIETLPNLPEMTDPYKLAAMRILMSSGSAAYIAAPETFALAVFTMVRLSVRYGNAPLSAFGYVTYGLILIGALGDIEAGYAFGRLGLNIMDRFQARELKAKIMTLFEGFIRHWQEPAKATLAPLLDGYQSGLETGDIEYAANCLLMYAYNAFTSGHELAWLEPELVKFIQVTQQFKQSRPLRANLLRRQMILNLLGRAENPLRLIGESYDEETMLPELLAANDRIEICVLCTYKAMLGYLFNDQTQALANASLAETYLDAIAGQIIAPVQNMYHSLALLALYPTVSPQLQKQYRQKVAANQKKLKKWARHAPLNHQHKYDLVEAEQARVLGQDLNAMEAYQRAVEAAKASENLGEEALAHELAARFYLARGLVQAAKAHLLDAHYAYLRWGAGAKVQDLQTRYSGLLAPLPAGLPAAVDSLFTVSPTAAAADAQSLDLTTVIKASQAISSEIVLDTLLEKLMKIVSENAGAQKGCLILEQAGHWVIEAQIEVDEAGTADAVTTLQAIPVELSPDVSPAIVNYVKRTRASLVLGDALHEGLFTADPYVLQHQSKSILCVPIIKQTHLLGLLYLENNLSAHTFTPDHLRVLELLSAQAAIAIENASLYRDLETSAKKYRSLFEDSKDTIYITTPAGEIIDINPAGENLFGYSKAELLRLKVIDLYVDPDDRLRFRREIEQHDLVRDFELKFWRKDRTQVDCLMTASAQRAADGTILTYRGIIRDVTQRKQTERELLRLSAYEQELTVARHIQHSLLPPPTPDWSGLEVICYSRPAREVGGDLYAYHAFAPDSASRPPAGKYAIVVGDVTGKGMPAALLMAVSLASFRVIVKQAAPPRELLAAMDTALLSYTPTIRQNCALVYVEINLQGPENPAGRRLGLANAGCIAPLLKQTDGSVEWVEVGGLPLGIGLGAKFGYQEVTQSAAKGDMIILTSDGVVEATNAAQEMFGFERLEQAVRAGPQTSAAAMLEYLQTQVTAFMAEQEPRDDITIVVVRL